MNIKKIITAGLVAAAAMLQAAETPDPVPYLDWDADNKKMTNAICAAYEIVRGDTTSFKAGTTYVVNSDTEVNKRIVVNGTAENPTRLILCDGKHLTARKGVEVAMSNDGSVVHALIVHGQSGHENRGGLAAYAGSWLDGGVESYDSAIGGGMYIHCGIVTINGGVVSADVAPGCYGACIGGSGGGTITINGGAVHASGDMYACIQGDMTINDGLVYAYGLIGCIEGGTVTINGGELIARSDSSCSVVCGNVTVNGGVVTAVSDPISDPTSYVFGGGVHGGSVTVNGGVLTAGSVYGEGIEGDHVTINGGMVTAMGGEGYAGMIVYNSFCKLISWGKKMKGLQFHKRKG